MKYIHRILAIALAIAFFILPAMSSAATLTWDRNAEADMASYSVYACFTPGCILARNAGMHMGVAQQTAVGIKPTFTIDLVNKEGSVAVTAKDKSGNESVFSVPFTFDQASPTAPANLLLLP